MPRSRSPNRDAAKRLYIDSGGSKKLKDIAAELGLKDSQVRKWKSEDQWEDELKGTLPKGKRNVTKQKERDGGDIAEEVKQVIDNPKLTDKQRLFCLKYVRCFNATKAYQKAYDVDYDTAASIAYRLLENDGVRAEIQRLKQNRLNREMLDETDVFQWYLDIARSDITDFMEFGNEEIETVDKAGNELKIKISTVNVKNDHEVDGTLISEISKGKDGVKVKLLDKMRAIEWLSEHMDLATEKQRAEIDAIRSKVNRDGENTESQIASYLDKLEEAVKDGP